MKAAIDGRRPDAPVLAANSSAPQPFVSRHEAETMNDYRIYRLDGLGRIVDGDWLMAPSDEDAVRMAVSRNCNGCELWLGERRVGQTPPKPERISE